MNEILEKAIETYGEDAQIDKAIEEMSELTKALLKDRHRTKDYEEDILFDAVAEEMADVHIMLEQLSMIYNNAEQVCRYQNEKLKRLEKRLNG